MQNRSGGRRWGQLAGSTGAVALVALLAAGCATNDATGKAGEARAALEADGSRVLAFGDKAGQLGLAPAMPERAAFGAPAIAVAPSGETLVLDALHSRVVKVSATGELTELAKVDHDADDLAVGPDGAFAVKRTTTPKVVVYSPQGLRLGELDTRILQDVERIEMGPSRRVIAVSAHQERYLLGSPTFPASEAEVLHSKREGIADRADGAGLVVLRDEKTHEISLVSIKKDVEQDKSVEVARVSVGRGDSARIVGVAGNVACMRVETLDGAAEISVKREAVCVDAVSGNVTFRTALGAPGTYVPHRELVLARGSLVFARPEARGLRLQTFAVPGIGQAEEKAR